MTEHTCWEGLDLIFRKSVDMWTQRGDPGFLVAVNYISSIIGGPKLSLFQYFRLPKSQDLH
jgi:hypothetical protein